MNRTVIVHVCFLLSLLLVVRCNDDADVEEDGQDVVGDYGEYDPPTKEYATDPKIISRNVKCLGKNFHRKLNGLKKI